MASTKVRYTATLPSDYVDELKEMAKGKKVPSVNFAINRAVDAYLKTQKAEQYEALLQDAGRDEAYLARTVRCSEDFKFADSEVSREW